MSHSTTEIVSVPRAKPENHQDDIPPEKPKVPKVAQEICKSFVTVADEPQTPKVQGTAPQEHVNLQNFYYEKVESFQKKINDLNRNLIKNQQLLSNLEG